MLYLTLEENEISGPEYTRVRRGRKKGRTICNKRALYKEIGKRAC